MVTALEYKTQGNAALAAGKLPDALASYTKGIELDGSNAVLLANRAQVYIKLEEYGSAVADASKALAADPGYVKAYYRRGVAYVGTLNYKSAIADFAAAAQRMPQSADAQAKLAETRKIWRMQAFMKAIEVADKPSVFEGLDIASMAADDELEPFVDAQGEVDPAKIDVDRIISDRFKRGLPLSRKHAFGLVKATKALLRTEPTMNEISVAKGETVTIVGDTHGQFYDLLHIFEKNGWPSETHKYVFNGDFVDRGAWSTEIAFTLFALKLKWPDKVFLNRGNHETDSMNVTYGFMTECTQKYKTEKMFQAFSEAFSTLPLATLVGGAYFVVHGGLFSKDGVLLDDIRKLDRFAHPQPGDSGLMMEMLWTDPQPEPGRSPSKRGIGMQFGPDVTKRFVEENGLKMVVRSHEVRMEGLTREHDGKLVTVFSAPNYCDSVGNEGAVLNIDSDLDMKPWVFKASPHPEPPARQNSSIFR